MRDEHTKTLTYVGLKVLAEVDQVDELDTRWIGHFDGSRYSCLSTAE
jgi:hypothetical protein